jgi:two-component system KDP operon response regulator KdpE
MNDVLVVDDEPQLLRALRITLTARGYDVHTAATGRRALAEATTRPPDLVILDLGLPDIDGAEVINRLRAQSAVPIIVLSGRTSGPDKVAALDAGADDYITKPFGIEELLARIRAVTRRTAPDDGTSPWSSATTTSTSALAGSPPVPAGTCGSRRPSGGCSTRWSGTRAS